jgi:hypothetical protein
MSSRARGWSTRHFAIVQEISVSPAVGGVSRRCSDSTEFRTTIASRPGI